MIPFRQKQGVLQTKKQACTDPVMHLFPMFPSEIQLKIWRYTFPGPRVISIRRNDDERIYSSNATPPVALFVCNQSREEAKRFYQLTFGSSIDNGRIWVSFDIDQVLFMIRRTSGDNCVLYSLVDLGEFVLNTKGVEKIKLLALYGRITDLVQTTTVYPTPKSWAEEVFYPKLLDLDQVWRVSALLNTCHLENGVPGVIVSFSKFSSMPCDDLSLVHDRTVNREQDIAREARDRKAIEDHEVVWSDVVISYRNQKSIFVDEYVKPRGIRPVVQFNEMEGLIDSTFLKVTDAHLIKRRFSLRMHLRSWIHRFRQRQHL